MSEFEPQRKVEAVISSWELLMVWFFYAFLDYINNNDGVSGLKYEEFRDLAEVVDDFTSEVIKIVSDFETTENDFAGSTRVKKLGESWCLRRTFRYGNIKIEASWLIKENRPLSIRIEVSQGGGVVQSISILPLLSEAISDEVVENHFPVDVEVELCFDGFILESDTYFYSGKIDGKFLYVSKQSTQMKQGQRNFATA